MTSFRDELEASTQEAKRKEQQRREEATDRQRLFDSGRDSKAVEAISGWVDRAKKEALEAAEKGLRQTWVDIDMQQVSFFFKSTDGWTGLFRELTGLSYTRYWGMLRNRLLSEGFHSVRLTSNDDGNFIHLKW